MKAREDNSVDLDALFGRMRAALRAESKHEGDIVRLDVDGLEEVVRQVQLAGGRPSSTTIDSLFRRLNDVRAEAGRLYGARDLMLAELTNLETLLRALLSAEKPTLAASRSRIQDKSGTKRGKAHSYFLSYSQKDAAQTDHFESLLRRKARLVLRDEADFEAGSDVNDLISTKIREAGTFVALWSANYKRSSWCLGELSFSADLIDGGEARLRLVLIELDDQAVPPRFSNILRLSGRDRTQRELAIVKLVAEER